MYSNLHNSQIQKYNERQIKFLIIIMLETFKLFLFEYKYKYNVTFLIYYLLSKFYWLIGNFKKKQVKSDNSKHDKTIFNPKTIEQKYKILKCIT